MILIDPCLEENFTFEGDVTIEFTMNANASETKSLTLNCLNIITENPTITEGKTSYVAKDFKCDSTGISELKADGLVFQPNHNYSVHFTYTGKINAGSAGTGSGLYYNTYKDPKGKDKFVKEFLKTTFLIADTSLERI